jgi:hypothetical protein
MSLLDYDRSLFERVRSIYDEVIFASPDEAFKINASQHGGQVLMPFVSVWRMPEFAINRAQYNDVRVRYGESLRLADSNIRKARGVPVTLTYQIDVYSNKRITCDGIASELLLNFLESPFVNVRFNFFGVTFEQQFEMVTSDNVSDNTNISDFEDTGRIYRLTIEVLLSEAIIYRVDGFDSKLVEKVLVDIKDIDTESIFDYLEVEGT